MSTAFGEATRNNVKCCHISWREEISLAIREITFSRLVKNHHA